MSEDKLQTDHRVLAGGEHTMVQIAGTIGVGRATLYRHLEKPAVTPNPLAAAAAEVSPTIHPPRRRRSAGGTLLRDTSRRSPSDDVDRDTPGPKPRRTRASSAPARIGAASDAKLRRTGLAGVRAAPGRAVRSRDEARA
jgi:hypothetical protein